MRNSYYMSGVDAQAFSSEALRGFIVQRTMVRWVGRLLKVMDPCGRLSDPNLPSRHLSIEFTPLRRRLPGMRV